MGFCAKPQDYLLLLSGGGVFHAVFVIAYFYLAALFVGAASSREGFSLKNTLIAAGSPSHTLITTHSGQNHPRFRGQHSGMYS